MTCPSTLKHELVFALAMVVVMAAVIIVVDLLAPPADREMKCARICASHQGVLDIRDSLGSSRCVCNDRCSEWLTEETAR